MPTSKDISVEDEAYLATIAAEPKMTMDEVGADIETHGHVPVTPETATKPPSDDSTKDALYHALDGSITADRDFNDDIPFTKDQRNDQDARLSDPTDDSRDETKGEVEGTTDTPQNLLHKFPSNKVNGDLDEDLKPTVQQDSAVQVKDSLAEALDAIAMDTIEGDHPTENKEMMEKYSEENASVVPQKVPDVPESLGGDKYKTDGNGLCYITAVFTVDPTKYISPNYRPAQQSGNIKNAAKIKKGKAKLQGMPMGGGEGGDGFTESAKKQAKESAMEPDEPTAKEEQAAAKEADKQQEIVEEKIEDKGNEQVEETKIEKVERKAEDEAPEKVVLDYATFIDGSSFMCFDKIAEIDYTKIAMDAGPKKKVTRENCETTFDQCRAQNPLFCRFHGPKLLEKDIKTAIKAACGPGCTVSVTRDKGANKFTFRLTVGCPPAKRDMVQKIVDMYMTQQPGITSAQTEMKKIEEKGGVEALTQEFDMDILKADEPPKKDKTDNLASVAIDLTKEYKDAGKKMPVVKETPNKIVKAANAAEQGEVEGGVQEQGGNGEEVDKAAEVAEIEKTEPITPKEDEIGNKGSEVPPDNPSSTPKPNPTETQAETQAETQEPTASEPNAETAKKQAKPAAQAVATPPVDDEAEFDRLVNEAENKGLFENNDFQKAYEGIFFDGKTDMAAKVAAMKALMEKTQGQGTGGGNTKPEKGKGSKGTGGAKVLPAPTSVAKNESKEEPTPQAEQPTEQPSQGNVQENQESEKEDYISDEELSDFLKKAGEDPWRYRDDFDLLKSAITRGTTWGARLGRDTMEWYKELADKVGDENNISKIIKKTIARLEKEWDRDTGGDEGDRNDGDIGEGELKNGDNDDSLEGEANSAAEILSSKTGKPIEELKKDLLARAKGETPITKTDLDFLTDSLGADNAIVRRMEDLYRSEGETRDLEESLKSARNALNGNPSADIKETAEDVKKEAEIAKEQTRIAEELEERLGTMHGSEGGLGNALAKAAIESAVVDAKDKAGSSRKKADDSAKRLQKLNEESYRRVEREAKGEAAARVEKALVEMARGIFGRDSKSETIAEEADAVSGWMEDLAKKKGVEYTPSPEFSDALEGVKKEAEQLEWLMGDLKKAMDVSGKDFQAEDINFLSESIGRKAAKIGRMFAELNGLGLSEIARINKAAELAEQKAKLEKRAGGMQSQGGDDDGRPSEQDFHLAAMEIANSGGDVFDDAFAGLAAIIDGKVQGFGAMSSEEMTREMAGRYIEALEKGGDKFKPMVEALKGAVEKLPKEDGNEGSDTNEKGEKQAKNDDTSKKIKAKESDNETSGSSGGEMDPRIEGIYKDWVEEPVPEWVKGLSADESKKYADMLEAARDWDSDETNTAFEELTKYEDAKSKEYDELKAKEKDESKKGNTPNGVDTSTTRKTKEEDVHEEHNGPGRQEVIDASKRLGIDAFKPEGELKRLLAIAKKLADRDKRMEQRAKDIETMLADREAKKNQKSTRGTGNYAGVVEDAMPKEAAMKIVADAVVKALEG